MRTRQSVRIKEDGRSNLIAKEGIAKEGEGDKGSKQVGGGKEDGGGKKDGGDINDGGGHSDSGCGGNDDGSGNNAGGNDDAVCNNDIGGESDSGAKKDGGANNNGGGENEGGDKNDSGGNDANNNGGGKNGGNHNDDDDNNNGGGKNDSDGNDDGGDDDGSKNESDGNNNGSGGGDDVSGDGNDSIGGGHKSIENDGGGNNKADANKNGGDKNVGGGENDVSGDDNDVHGGGNDGIDSGDDVIKDDGGNDNDNDANNSGVGKNDVGDMSDSGGNYDSGRNDGNTDYGGSNNDDSGGGDDGIDGDHDGIGGDNDGGGDDNNYGGDDDGISSSSDGNGNSGKERDNGSSKVDRGVGKEDSQEDGGNHRFYVGFRFYRLCDDKIYYPALIIGGPELLKDNGSMSLCWRIGYEDGLEEDMNEDEIRDDLISYPCDTGKSNPPPPFLPTKQQVREEEKSVGSGGSGTGSGEEEEEEWVEPRRVARKPKHVFEESDDDSMESVEEDDKWEEVNQRKRKGDGELIVRKDDILGRIHLVAHSDKNDDDVEDEDGSRNLHLKDLYQGDPGDRVAYEDIPGTPKRRKVQREGMAIGVNASGGGVEDISCWKNIVMTPTIRKVVEDSLLHWNPKFSFMVEIFKSCKWIRESIFSQACSIVRVMADEAGVTMDEILGYRSFQIRFKKIPGTTHHNILMKAHKIWNFARETNSASMHMKSPSITSLQQVIHRLYDLMRASYQDRKREDVKSEPVPPFILNATNFGVHVEHLLKLLILTIVLVEDSFKIRQRTNDNESLFQFCEKLFHKTYSREAHWRVLENMIRLCHQETDEKTMDYLGENPLRAVDEMESKVDPHDPESYRDWLVGKITYSRKKRQLFLDKDSLKERNVLLYKFYVIQHNYSKPDCRYPPHYKPVVLYSSISLNQSHAIKQKMRIQRLNLLKDKPYDDPVQLKEDERKKKQNEQKKERKKQEQKEKEQELEEPTLSDPREDESEGGTDVDKTVPTPQKGGNNTPSDNNAASTNVGINFAESGEENSEDDMEVEDNAKGGKYNNDAAQETNAPSDNAASNKPAGMLGVELVGQQQQKSTTLMNNDSATTITASPMKHQKISSLVFLRLLRMANKSDLATSQYVLKYETENLMQYFYALGKMDLIWSSNLQLTPHALLPYSEIMKTISWSQKRGHLWVPAEQSDPRIDAGILRKDHAVMIKYLYLLRDFDFDMVLQYLDLYGKPDFSREKKSGKLPITTPMRVNAGGSHRNYACREGEREPWTLLRDPTRTTVPKSMEEFQGGRLMREIGKLMDYVQCVLDEVLPIRILDDHFIYETFARPFVEKFSCKHCRFPCFDMGVADIDEGSETPGVKHTDNNNGKKFGNNLSATFSRIFRAKSVSDAAREQYERDGNKTEKEIGDLLSEALGFLFDGNPKLDSERIKRFYFILFTRFSHEFFKDHERLAESLKSRLRTVRDKVDEGYKQLGGSFDHPDRITIKKDSPFENNVIISKEHPALTVSRVLVPANYCREVKCAAAITVLVKSWEKLVAVGCTETRKLLDLLLVMLYLGSFAKFFYVSEEFIESLTSDNFGENLTVKYTRLMNQKFGTWAGGPDHRGHPTSIKIEEIYEDEEVHSAAIDAMENFGKILENSILTLPEFKDEIVKLVLALPGIGLFYGQNLALYMGLCGYVTKNLQNTLLAFPVDKFGSANTIEEENVELQRSLEKFQRMEPAGPTAIQMAEFGFHTNPKDFMKTVRIVSGFCGIDARPCWVECIFCDCIGPSITFDWIFKGQSMFWIFKEVDEYGQIHYIAREKRADGLLYEDVQLKL